MRQIDTTNGAGSDAAGFSVARPAVGNSSAPQLRALVTEATRALARLDVGRLQELALSCEALTRMPLPETRQQREEIGGQAAAARCDMAVFARVLEATRANVKVVERLRELRTGNLEYSEHSGRYLSAIPRDSEGGHGNN